MSLTNVESINGGDGVADDNQQNENFDAADGAETHKQKVIEISAKLAAIPDQDIIDACERRKGYDAERKVINDKAAEDREVLKEKGIKGPAFNAAYARYCQDEYERELYDQQFAKCANAMGVEFQPGLFNE